MPDLTQLPATVAVGLQIAVIIIAALIGYVAVRTAVGIGVRHIMERKVLEGSPPGLPPAELERRVQTVGSLVVRIAGAVLAVIAGLMALQLFGIDIGPAVAGLGVAGIAVGFGAQTLVRDWLAGIFVIVENQYNQGDVVRVAGVEGTVEDFSLRRTLLRDVDGTAHSVPNGQIIVASNLTRRWARIHLSIPLVHADDRDRAVTAVDRVGRAMLADATWADRLLDAPAVAPAGAADGTVTVIARAQAAHQGAVLAEVRGRVLAALTGDGVEVGDDGEERDDAD